MRYFTFRDTEGHVLKDDSAYDAKQGVPIIVDKLNTGIYYAPANATDVIFRSRGKVHVAQKCNGIWTEVEDDDCQI
jgi:hypothetical protein